MQSMSYYTFIWSAKMNQNYRLYGVMFGIAGAMHAIRLLQLIIFSIQARKFVLRSNSATNRDLASEAVSRISSRVSSSVAVSLLLSSFTTAGQRSSILWTTRKTWRAVFSRYGILGIESRHFFTVFALRELVETSAQTYLVNKSSMLVPSAKLNLFNVVLLVTTCWSTAAIQYFLKRSPVLQRVALFLCDAILSFGMMVVVPLVIFIPYVQVFNVSEGAFKNPNFLHDTVTISTLSLENQLIFASSFIDFATKFIPHIGILLSLMAVTNLVSRHDTRYNITQEGSVEVPKTIRKVNVRLSSSKTYSGPVQGPSVSSQVTPADQRETLRWPRKWEHTISLVVFLIWGLVILSLHVAAAQRATNYQVAGCRTITQPWFSSGKEPCSSLIYDCHARNTSTLDDASLEKLDPGTLVGLAVVHCPALRMPTTFQKFTSLMMIHIFNSTITSWDVDSSISASKHTRLLAILLRNIQLSEIPVGMRQPLPRILKTIRISGSNLSELPDDLSSKWSGLAVLAIEDSNLKAIPSGVFAMNVVVLSFMGNQVQVISPEATVPSNTAILQLRLSKNPLQELPESLMAPNSLIMSFNVQNTSLKSFPSWVETQTRVVWAYDTPFCKSLSAAAPTSTVKCFNPGTSTREPNFPVELFEQLYAIH
ncbi:hypothetical protein PI124_g15678 [Phytophthora idaei]|nr:hypothetical protein PI125_g15940 [Phytophthora idaei]KAG3142526.1 hypothetical protein PI126_g15019 [Phytophthora idaei]KAG3239398.1 hypothetical protein PI124_g15678 [Phytophthora idaei]